MTPEEQYFLRKFIVRLHLQGKKTSEIQPRLSAGCWSIQPRIACRMGYNETYRFYHPRNCVCDIYCTRKSRRISQSVSSIWIGLLHNPDILRIPRRYYHVFRTLCVGAFLPTAGPYQRFAHPPKAHACPAFDNAEHVYAQLRVAKTEGRRHVQPSKSRIQPDEIITKPGECKKLVVDVSCRLKSKGSTKNP